MIPDHDIGQHAGGEDTDLPCEVPECARGAKPATLPRPVRFLSARPVARHRASEEGGALLLAAGSGSWAALRRAAPNGRSTFSTGHHVRVGLNLQF
jgi:hypothetical protein